MPRPRQVVEAALCLSPWGWRRGARETGRMRTVAASAAARRHLLRQSLRLGRSIPSSEAPRKRIDEAIEKPGRIR